VANSEGKGPLLRPRGWGEDNAEMALRELECEGLYCIHLAQDLGQWRARLNTVMNLWVPQNSGNFWRGLEIVIFSRRAQLHGII
jgi:hypothetical protein